LSKGEDRAAAAVKDRNARFDQQEILDLIDEEVDAARASTPGAE
jgi:hypothetical protein